jgi:hypothetical protein
MREGASADHNCDQTGGLCDGPGEERLDGADAQDKATGLAGRGLLLPLR